MAVAQAAGTGQFPEEANELVGRTAELRQVDALLRDSRLVTLTGPGGVGKTRVALRAALAAASRYSDGPCFVEFSALRDPELLPQPAATSAACRAKPSRAWPEGRGGIALARTLTDAGLNDETLLARGYLNLGVALIIGGQLDEAARVDKEAEARLVAADDRTGLLMLCTHDGHRCQLTGQPDETLAWHQRFETLFGPSRERWLHGWMHLVAAMAFFQRPGREGECGDMLRTALTEKSELNDTSGIAYALEILGWLTQRGGRHARTAWLLGAADAQWQLIGIRVSGTPAMEDHHQQAMAACRAALGPERCAALFARGAELPLARVIALTHSDADDPDAP